MAKGFSLIELMVVITIVGIMLVVGLPLTDSWIKDAQLEKDQATFKGAMGQARALAMRNGAGVFGPDQPAVALCRDDFDLHMVFAALPIAPAVLPTPASCAELVPTTPTTPTTATLVGKFGKGFNLKYSGQTPTKKFCSALFDSKGAMKLCELKADGTCETTCTPLDQWGIVPSVDGVEDEKPLTVF